MDGHVEVGVLRLIKNLSELVGLVEDMREHQRMFRESNSIPAFLRAQASERKVDQWLREFREPRQIARQEMSKLP